jgi:hypothetical protein
VVFLHIDLTPHFQSANWARSIEQQRRRDHRRRRGSVLIQGQLKAQFLNQGASGGLIDITAGGDFTTTASSLITAAGGTDSTAGATRRPAIHRRYGAQTSKASTAASWG